MRMGAQTRLPLRHVVPAALVAPQRGRRRLPGPPVRPDVPGRDGPRVARPAPPGELVSSAPPLPGQDVWDVYHAGDAEWIAPVERAFDLLSRDLLALQRTFDYGDEAILAEAAWVDAEGPPLCWLFSSSVRRNIEYRRTDELNSQHRGRSVSGGYFQTSQRGREALHWGRRPLSWPVLLAQCGLTPHFARSAPGGPPAKCSVRAADVGREKEIELRAIPARGGQRSWMGPGMYNPGSASAKVRGLRCE